MLQDLREKLAYDHGEIQLTVTTWPYDPRDNGTHRSASRFC
jgi:hypothetical protein